MPYSVEIYFEEEIENIIRDIWKELAYDNISSYMLYGNYRPHISLTVFEKYEIGFEREFKNFSENLPELEIKFDSIGIFPRPEGVVYLGVVVNDALLSFHQNFHKQFDPYVIGTRSYYLPGNWVPHCSSNRDMVMTIHRMVGSLLI